ncbi:N-formylglutamate amidohydrolase [Pseudochelatococcus sp. B33]
MRHAAQDFSPPFTIFEPVSHGAPVVFNVPHAGRVYPQAFLDESRLDPVALRRSEDAWVDRLFAGVVRLGAPLMVAHFPRAYLDLNREPGEFDPRLFTGRLPAEANTRSARVAGGLGTIPRVVGDGQDIYPGRIPFEEGLTRVEALYKPYHLALRDRLARTHASFGAVLLIDCHSMPTPATAAGGTRTASAPDIVLGDRFGMSCAPAAVGFVERALQMRGYSVVRNRPYAGGYITEHYGTPASGCHALQIEICRSLYMDEKTLEPTADFARVAGDLAAVADLLMRASSALLTPLHDAAE